MGRLADFITGRRTKWAVAALWAVALVVTIAAGLPAAFSENEKNDSKSFLPGDAESTRALDITTALNDGDVAPTVIVYRRPEGLTEQDRRLIASDVERLNEATGEFDNTTEFGPPDVSRDRTTALLTNQIKGTGESGDILDPIDEYRDLVSEGREDPVEGLATKVSGPAGVSADAIKVFESINGTLVGAAFSLVIVLLILIYRSPIFWLLPILAVGVAEIAARGFGWAISEAGVTVNGQSSSILSVLVIGAGTDYALLLVARYREELRRHEDKHEAMNLALRRAGPAIIASGLTVCLALLCLALAEDNGTAGLGPIGAMGVAVAMLVMLTLLPALLVITGRRPFWPFVPRFGGEGADETHGRWRKVGERVAASPRRVAAGAVLLLAVMSLGLLNFSTDLTQSNSFRNSVESIEGQELIAQAFPQGQSAPTDLVIPAGSEADPAAVARAASSVEGVVAAPPRPVREGEAGTQLAAFLDRDPYSTEAFDVIPDLRDAVEQVPGEVLVGGPTAIEVDRREAAVTDSTRLIPLSLLVVFIILVVLLRALVAPVLLIATVILSLLAALGVGAVVFDVLFDFPGSEPSLPLFAFIFLVALGVDYNIFLMARVREETLEHGTRDGMLRGVAVTGGVITSAGIVLAGTFAVLAVLPLVFLTQIGFVIAFGVLLDTFLVRSVLVPALTFMIGPRIWLPSRLAREDGRMRE